MQALHGIGIVHLHHIQKDAGASLPGPGQTLEHGVALEAVQHQKSADVKHAGRLQQPLRNRRRAHGRVGAGIGNEAPVLIAHVDHRGGGRGHLRRAHHPAGVHPRSIQGCNDEVGQHVVANATADPGAHAQPGQIEGGVGGAAPQAELHAFGFHQLPLLGQRRHRVAHQISAQQAEAEAVHGRG